MAKKEEFLLVKIFFPAIMQKPNFVGKAKAVSSENRLGKFDILPRHINFISLIFNQISILTPENEKIEFKFERGILVVRENQVKVFLGL